MVQNNQIQTQTQGFHVEIMDGLRGIAILMVVLFHTWEISWLDHTIVLGNFKIDLNFIPISGFLGVALFFFISAFCLFYPYAKYMFEGAKFQTWKKFAYKRAIKIIPSYYLSIILILIFLNTLNGTVTQNIWQVITHLLFIHSLPRFIWLY